MFLTDHQMACGEKIHRSHQVYDYYWGRSLDTNKQVEIIFSHLNKVLAAYAPKPG
jgi:hypothetical protein